MGDDQTRFDGFAETHLIGEDHPFEDGRPQGKERRIDLMWVQVYAGIEEGAANAVYTRSAQSSQFVSKILGMVGGDHGKRM